MWLRCLDGIKYFGGDLSPMSIGGVCSWIERAALGAGREEPLQLWVRSPGRG